jgi:hypothetical protein
MLESHTSLTSTTLDQLYQQDQEWRIRRSYARAGPYFSLYDIRHNIDTEVEESIRHQPLTYKWHRNSFIVDEFVKRHRVKVTEIIEDRLIGLDRQRTST